MLAGRRILAVVPARGGSKGVRLKNIRLLSGLPLIAHVAPVIHAVECIDRAVVSTEDDRIADVAKAHGLDSPFLRPIALAGDTIGDIPVLQHALIETERLDGKQYQIVVMLQPTCPLRKPEHVRGVISTLVDGEWDAVWTVSEAPLKFHPLKQLRLSDSRLEYYDPAASAITARQQLEPLYYRNGAAYALTRDCLMKQGALLGARTAATVIDDELVNIDTIEDFDEAERLLADQSAQR
jgi:CMP-N,N'-diacetyllegionaminic acid synthase